MCWRTGTLRHGLRLGGSRMSPPGMSMVPGVATPMAATWSMRRPAAATAARMVSHMRSRPNSWPRYASVGRLRELRTRPLSSTTPPFMLVPPTSSPTQINGVIAVVWEKWDADTVQGILLAAGRGDNPVRSTQYRVHSTEQAAARQTPSLLESPLIPWRSGTADCLLGTGYCVLRTERLPSRGNGDGL